MMKRRTKFFLAAALGLTVVLGATGAYAFLQAETSTELRATGMVGEQADGYLALVKDGSADLRARVNNINIKRRAAYTELARQRGAQIEEVAATMACEIFATSILPGQYYRLPDGVWRKRNGNEPVPRPAYCS
jgi:hypothetical protein